MPVYDHIGKLRKFYYAPDKNTLQTQEFLHDNISRIHSEADDMLPCFFRLEWVSGTPLNVNGGDTVKPVFRITQISPVDEPIPSSSFSIRYTTEGDRSPFEGTVQNFIRFPNSLVTDVPVRSLIDTNFIDGVRIRSDIPAGEYGLNVEVSATVQTTRLAAQAENLRQGFSCSQTLQWKPILVKPDFAIEADPLDYVHTFSLQAQGTNFPIGMLNNAINPRIISAVTTATGANRTFFETLNIHIVDSDILLDITTRTSVSRTIPVTLTIQSGSGDNAEVETITITLRFIQCRSIYAAVGIDIGGGAGRLYPGQYNTSTSLSGGYTIRLQFARARATKTAGRGNITGYDFFDVIGVSSLPSWMSWTNGELVMNVPQNFESGRTYFVGVVLRSDDVPTCFLPFTFPITIRRI